MFNAQMGNFWIWVIWPVSKIPKAMLWDFGRRLNKNMNLKGKVAVVTGASDGIGKIVFMLSRPDKIWFPEIQVEY